jgi:hypothetical protein
MQNASGGVHADDVLHENDIRHIGKLLQINPLVLTVWLRTRQQSISSHMTINHHCPALSPVGYGSSSNDFR